MVTGHPEADPRTGAAHACGHNAQIAGLIGAAIGLVTTRALEHLGGRVSFIDAESEQVRTITGFELGAGVVEWTKKGGGK